MGYIAKETGPKKNDNPRILIVGAGAIGRGFVSNIFQKAGFSISFVENNQTIYSELSKKRSFQTATTDSKRHFLHTVYYNEVYKTIDDCNISKYDLVLIAVGVNSCLDIANRFKEAKIVYILENDINIIQNIKQLSSNNQIYFGIPDVITSNTASNNLLSIDPLCVVSEQGQLILEKSSYQFPTSQYINIVNKQELWTNWNCKFYIHNAPHAIIAYLGFQKKYAYIHQAMADQTIENVVIDAMTSISKALIRLNIIPEKIADDYMKKEIKRFRNPLLFDPISRVARDPIRKLSSENRLIKGLSIIQKAGLNPIPFYIGINAALKYTGCTDKKNSFNQMRENFFMKDLLINICGIKDHKTLKQILDIQHCIESE